MWCLLKVLTTVLVSIAQLRVFRAIQNDQNKEFLKICLCL